MSDKTTTFPFSKPYQTQFTPNPGEYNEVICELCGSKAVVKRSEFSATGWAESMGGHKHEHDTFTCPVNDAEPAVSDDDNIPDEALHSRMAKMKKEIKATGSTTLKEILSKDILSLFNTLQLRIFVEKL